MNEPQFREIGGRVTVNMRASTLNQPSGRRTTVSFGVPRAAHTQVGYEGVLL